MALEITLTLTELIIKHENYPTNRNKTYEEKQNYNND